jgi:hypothetical protein
MPLRGLKETNMARTLTTPIAQPDETQQAISGFRIEVPHIRNVGDTAMEISKSQVQLWYEVITYNLDGDIVKKAQRIVPFADWPVNFKIDIKAAYAKMMLDAVASGLIDGDGTDEPLE